MIKFMGVVSLKPDVDPDEAWKYWREKHTLWVKDKMLPEAKKYVINRVIQTFGEVHYFGVGELWFDDMDSALRAINRLRNAPPDHLLADLISGTQRSLVEEIQLIPPIK